MSSMQTLRNVLGVLRLDVDVALLECGCEWGVCIGLWWHQQRTQQEISLFIAPAPLHLA